MPIHDLGYRAWEGDLGAGASRRRVIAQTGFRLAWRSQWLRRLMMLAWLPATYMGVVFFFYEQALVNPDWLGGARWLLGQFMDLPELQAALASENPADSRHDVWALLLLSFFRYPQGMLMLLVVGLIAPPLISQDVRSKAFLLYFSRPVTRVDYILGKMAVIFRYVVLITTLPALALYVMGVLMSPEISVVTYTWDLPLRIVAASAVLMIPTAAMALAFSSMTSKTFHAGFAWFAVWALGWVAYVSIYTSQIDIQGSRLIAEGGGQILPAKSQWYLLSLYHTLGEVQSWVFGLHPHPAEVWPAVAMLIGLTLVSLVVLFRHVSSPMRV